MFDPLTERWPPVYDADELASTISDMLTSGRLETNFYTSMRGQAEICQGDIVALPADVPVIAEDGVPSMYEAKPPFWLVIGNSQKGAELPASYRAATLLHNGLHLSGSQGFIAQLNTFRRIERAFDPSESQFYDGEIDSNFDGQLDGIESMSVGGSIISLNDLLCPIEVASDFVLFHPLHRTRSGEPSLAVFDHGNAALAEPVSDFGVGAFFLRVLASAVLDDGSCSESAR